MAGTNDEDNINVTSRAVDVRLKALHEYFLYLSKWDDGSHLFVEKIYNPVVKCCSLRL